MAKTSELISFILKNNLSQFVTGSFENLYSSSSFRNDQYGDGLRTTQQTNIDFSKFENHCFFNSAVAKTNLAFEKIINKYPFDGTKKDLNDFMDNLSGFEKYIFDNFPSNFGFLNFNSSLENHIQIVDEKGYYATQKEFEIEDNLSVIDPQNNSFTIEFHINVPPTTNNNQIIVQKKNDTSNHGFAVYLSSSTSTTIASIGMCLFSGSFYNDVKFSIDKNKFNHIAFVVDRSKSDYTEIISYLNGGFISGSNKQLIKETNTKTSPLIIGSGSNFDIQTTYIPSQTFSGSLDEFRFFHEARTSNDISYYYDKNVYSTDNLKLYYRFNEPADISPNTGDAVNSIVLDYSGNSFHSNIENYVTSLRKNINDDNTSLLISEKEEYNKILFPGNSEILALNGNLLADAKDYDDFNPNVIYKLFPKHYFIDGQLFQSFDDLKGDIAGSFDEDNLDQIPGEFKLKNVQLFLSFLYIFANYFDELKIFVDAIVNINNFSYNTYETPPSNFLLDLNKINGLNVNNILNTSFNPIEYSSQEIIDENGKKLSVREIQDEILKRLLINSNFILKSKGTLESIKMLMRCIGIDPDISLRIKEHGGKNTKISSMREIRKKIDGMLKFDSDSYVTSSFLRKTRETSIGYPPPSGNSNNDSMFLSGSWTVEFLAKYNKREVDNNEFSSLIRLHTVGSDIPINEGCISNIVADADLNKLTWYFNFEPSSSVNSLEFEGIPIYDNDIWYISVGKEYTGKAKNNYFFKVAKPLNYDEYEIYQTSSYIQDTNINIQSLFSLENNASGSYLSIGNIPNQNNTQSRFLTDEEQLYTETYFNISNLKFWTKTLSENEEKEHIINPFSFGADINLVNNIFEKNHSASYESLKMYVINKYNDKNSNDIGEVFFNDITGNEIHLYGDNFNLSDKVLKPETFYYSIISPNFDDNISFRKIRKHDDLDDYYKNDNNILEISLSLIDSLNDEIINILSNTKEIENYLNDPNSIQSTTYKNVDYNRELFFSNLSKKLNFKLFFDFTKYFDLALSNAVSYLIPTKTKFKGITRNIESHMLERTKIEYKIPVFYLHKDIFKTNKDAKYPSTQT
jgi:hypothetical protein